MNGIRTHFHILKCKTRFQADESASKRFGLFSSPIETALSADVSPLQRLKSAYHVECEAPCAATTAASHPSSCRQRSPPLRRREEEQARYIVRGCSCAAVETAGCCCGRSPQRCAGAAAPVLAKIHAPPHTTVAIVCTHRL